MLHFSTSRCRRHRDWLWEPSPQIEKEIIRLENNWAECFRTGNPSAAKQFIAEDFIGVSSKAVRYSKKEALKKIVESKRVFRSFAAKDITVRIYGETAIAQGTDAWVLADKSQKKGSSIWTDTWIRVNGQWQLVAAQDILPAGYRE
jgi:hypothetical protein